MSDSFVHLPRLADAEAEGDQLFTAYALLQSAEEGRTKDRRIFFDLKLSDSSAVLQGKIWSDAERAIQNVQDLQPGIPVKILFEARNYRGSVQLNIRGIREVVQEEDEHYDASRVLGDGVEKVANLHYRTLVFDIETVPGVELRELPPTIAKALTLAAERDSHDEAKVMSLSPYFGQVVSLAMGDGESDPDEQEITTMIVPPPGRENDEFPEGVIAMSEEELLRAFWFLASRADVVVSYNGRSFDVPFLVTRSLVHNVPVRVDLLSKPYSFRPHLDLYAALSRRRPLGPASLDVVCWALGISSPKGEMDGSMVAPTYAQGNIELIAEYNAGDVTATTAVYQRVRDQLLPFISGS